MLGITGSTAGTRVGTTIRGLFRIRIRIIGALMIGKGIGHRKRHVNHHDS